ncbi:hypothetical protein CBER1_00445 [Cercospora berteroae]|uniref:Uncharacterized protein n=1 Tax=Cercospora berteroae TaxID=357750 RepID=A0A2S6C1K0_9PEZI|nr:hypothetical protein CBER1_00445 [Cercospora berteroae]
MLTYLLLTLAAAAVAFAAPQSPAAYQPLSKPISNGEFGLTMRIIDEVGEPRAVALVATKNGTNEELVLVGQPLASNSGTPAYTTNTNAEDANGFDFVALNVDVDGTSYGLFAADVGSVYGIQTTVIAVKGMQQEEWLVSDEDDGVYRKLAAANNQFMACAGTVNGQPAVVLSWGINKSNGISPDGCDSTTVKKNCNVPGSTAKCPKF